MSDEVRATDLDEPSSWPAGLSDGRLVLLVAFALFALSAWPLLLVALPPLQDLPNHVASAHIIAHPTLYPAYAFNGFFKTNSMLTIWLHLFGGLGLFGAARAFTALVLALTAFAVPLFVLRFAGRRHLPVAMGFAWPLVHSYSVAMGFLNFSFGFAVALILLMVLDRQREAASVQRGLGIAALAGLLWFAHPFPVAVVGALVALHAATRPTWRDRIAASLALLAPLAPAGLLALLSAGQHLVKAEHTTATATAVVYLNPVKIVSHLWSDVSGALTRWGAVTAVPALLLPFFAWKDRRTARLRYFFSGPAMAALALAYFASPLSVSNWWCLNCRLVPFLWAGLLLRLPTVLPRRAALALAAAAVWFSAATGVDYVRLDRDRAAFTAGIDAVPARATLLPLLFKQSKQGEFTTSLTHAWGYYTVAKDTSAPLVFAVERSYPITYRDFPPRALIPPALDNFADQQGTPAGVCRLMGEPSVDAACTVAWRERWRSFWELAEPRFSHLLTWAMPPEARPMIPPTYRRTFAAGELEIYARQDGAGVGVGKELALPQNNRQEIMTRPFP
jgi:hypothetical protein